MREQLILGLKERLNELRIQLAELSRASQADLMSGLNESEEGLADKGKDGFRARMSCGTQIFHHLIQSCCERSGPCEIQRVPIPQLYAVLYEIGAKDLWFKGTDLTSEGRLSMIMKATRRVHNWTRRVESGCPAIRIQWKPVEWKSEDQKVHRAWTKGSTEVIKVRTFGSIDWQKWTWLRFLGNLLILASISDALSQLPCFLIYVCDLRLPSVQ
uniref:Uncharacterized protein n=1 Tax=Lactuca sativa TaxID=4236 RepID=A0A9R1V772_LACSA|nr:hypothetical protein LSAT_V11C600338390 [Lactuca sativa]